MGGRLNTRVTVEPVPHFISDGVLTEKELAEVSAHWLDSALIPEESPGSGYKVAHIKNFTHRQAFSKQQLAFWDRFAVEVGVPLMREIIHLYQPWISPKFGDLINRIDVITIAMTEFEHDKVGVGEHCHAHDPTWLYTALIHIEDGGDGRGNALFGFKDLNADVYRQLASVAPHDAVAGNGILRRYDFRPGRIFSFFETPLSYHGTGAVAGDVGNGKRRMIRIHVAAPTELTQDLYGVPYQEYRAMKYAPGFKQQMHDWITRDVDLMRRPAPTIKSDWAASVPIVLPTQ
jgi:hypothetical protein